MSFLRTSKILFKPNCTNQVKLDELSDFIDLCNNALNFYIVRFIEFYKLDELLFVNAKHKNKKLFSKKHCSNLTKLNNIFYELVDSTEEDVAAISTINKNTNTLTSLEESKSKFKRKLKFYPDEIIIDYASTSHSASTLLPFSLIALSGRTLKSVKTQAMGIINSWLKEILRSYQFGYFNQDKYKKVHRKMQNCKKSQKRQNKIKY